MDPLLNEIEVRALASLIEKETTTPEYYPLSLNALTLACNQKTNRDPVVSFTDDTVSEALDSLRAKKLARSVAGAVQTKVGLLEAASGGTVLLDEVGELPITTQAKLLRALETHELLRIRN